MIGIIVCGHGSFASGLKTAVELIAGTQRNIYFVDFNIESTTEDLECNINKALFNLINKQNSVLIMTDLIGGSPFKISATIKEKSENRINVVSGTNLGMILEIIFLRNNEDDLDIVTKKALEVGKNQIQEYIFTKVDYVTDDFCDEI